VIFNGKGFSLLVVLPSNQNQAQNWFLVITPQALLGSHYQLLIKYKEKRMHL
jgi:hypothetical protein